jgi:hypothetical protein
MNAQNNGGYFGCFDDKGVEADIIRPTGLTVYCGKCRF